MATIGSLAIATIGMGAARLHANVALSGDDQATVERAFATRVVYFQPNGLAPTAFADWADTDKGAAE